MIVGISFPKWLYFAFQAKIFQTPSLENFCLESGSLKEWGVSLNCAAWKKSSQVHGLIDSIL